jgi:hypothetical protein
LPVDALIKELLATGHMNEETTADLNRWLADSEAGKLDPDDEGYVRALHARLTGAPPSEPEEVAAGPGRLDGLTAEEWRDRALRAEAELAAYRDQSTAP